MKKSLTVTFEQTIVGGEMKMQVKAEGVQGPSEALRMLHQAMTFMFGEEERVMLEMAAAQAAEQNGGVVRMKH